MREGISKRALAAKQQGRLGGLATARNHNQDFLAQRSTKGGCATRDKYGIDYYRYLQTLKPKTKNHKEKSDEIIRTVIPEKEPLPKDTLELIVSAAKTLA